MSFEARGPKRLGVFARRPWLHLLWAVPLALPCSAQLFVMAAVAWCGFDGCGDTSDSPDSAILLLALGAAVLAAPLVLVPWARRLWVRALAGVLLIALAALGIAIALAAPPPGPQVDLEAVLSDEEQFALFQAQNGTAWVSDVPGGRVGFVDGHVAVMVTAAGGVVHIERVSVAPGTPCGYLTDTWIVPEPRYPREAEPTWCVQDGDLWAREDGTGITGVQGGEYLVAHSADATYVTIAGGDRPATADEVAEAYDSLRPISEHELRAAFVNQQVSGER